MVTGGMLLWPMEQAGEVLRLYRDLMAAAPDEISGAVAIVIAPPAPFVPAELQGKPVFAVIPISFGDRSCCGRSASSGRRSSTSWADAVPGVQQLLDPGNPRGSTTTGRPSWSRSSATS